MAKQNLHGKTVKDYIYCETCDIWADLWKYDTVENAGHDKCNWRYATESELKSLVKDCEQMGCFEEN